MLILQSLKNRVSKYQVKSTKNVLLKICIMLSFLGRSLFCKDSQVLFANKNHHNALINPFRNSTMTLALAAMPIVAVPIQEVQLFDYAVAHEIVNAGYGLIINTDEDFYLG